MEQNVINQWLASGIENSSCFNESESYYNADYVNKETSETMKNEFVRRVALLIEHRKNEVVNIMNNANIFVPENSSNEDILSLIFTVQPAKRTELMTEIAKIVRQYKF